MNLRYRKRLVTVFIICSTLVLILYIITMRKGDDFTKTDGSNLIKKLLLSSKYNVKKTIPSTLPKKMKVFDHSLKRLSFQEFKAISEKVFGIECVKDRVSEYYFDIHGKEYFLQYSRTSGWIEYSLIRTAFPTNDNKWRECKNFPSMDDCKKIATETIEKYNLKKVDMYLANIVDTTKDGNYYIEVIYNRRIDAYECIGPGNAVVISIDGEGRMARLSYNWQELNEIGSCSVISPRSAFEKIKNGNGILFASGWDKIGDLVQVELMYPITGRETKTRINPAYIMYFENKNEGKYKPEFLHAYAPAIEE